MSSGFWLGPHGMKVPDAIESVPSSDGVNTCHKAGYETEMYAPANMRLTKEQYLAKYAVRSEASDDYWYRIPAPDS